MIQLVTSDRQILRKIQLGSFMFMFDSLAKLDLFRFKAQNNAIMPTDFELTFVNYYCQIETFGCFMDGFIRQFLIK